MKKILILLCICPLMAVGQISFIKHYRTNSWVDQVARPYELANGNFICSALLPNNNVWYNYIYLFSECGELITRLLVSAPDDYMLINNFVQLDSTSVLATGYKSDSIFKTVYLVLDIHSLDLVHQKLFFETSLYHIDRSFVDNGVIYQLGSRGDRVVSTSLNDHLVRNLHLYRSFNDDEYPGLRFSYRVAYSDNRVYSLEEYRDTAYRYSSVLRCLDRKLREIYTIDFIQDSVFTTIDNQIIDLGSDTILLVAKEQDYVNHTSRRFIRQYVRDILLYEREVQGFDQFADYSICDYAGGIVRCFKNDGAAGEFNKYGELLYYSDHLEEQLVTVGLSNAIRTRDGGAFSIGHSFVYFDGVLESALGLVKITKDYQFSDAPHPRCIVATQDVDFNPNIVLYPNPTNGSIHITSDVPVLQYRIFDTALQMLISGMQVDTEFDIDLDLNPGMYFVHLETRHGWFAQKVLILE